MPIINVLNYQLLSIIIIFQIIKRNYRKEIIGIEYKTLILVLNINIIKLNITLNQ